MKNQSVNTAHANEYEKWLREMCKVDNVRSEFPKTEEEAKDHTLCMVKELVLPDGYEFRDENGNVIEAKKIVLEKKKPNYPKTEDECMGEITDEEYAQLRSVIAFRLVKLICCRDAYWKLAGDWKPDYDSGVDKFGIVCYDGVVQKSNAVSHWERPLNKVLEFPTSEMRDAFYENFKDLIDACKELL